MENERNIGRTAALVVVAFLALAALQLWWNRSEKNGTADERDMRVAPTQIEAEDQHLEIGAGKPGSQWERPEVRRREMQRLLSLLSNAPGDSERRSAALRLRYLADESAGPALVRLLNDKDGVVAQRCAETLVRLWQRSDSPRVNQFFRQGLEAYEAGDYEKALELFDACASLDADIPDLYRLRAEIFLEMDRTGEALKECRRALRHNEDNFLAHCALAKCYRDMRDGEAALESVNRALSIYPGFEAARQLRKEILSLQRAGEL